MAKEGESEGIGFAFDAIQRTPNTVAAHALVGLAQEQGRADAVLDALFRAYFEEAQDIGDTETLAALAQRCQVSGWPRQGAATEVVALEQQLRELGTNSEISRRTPP